MQLARQQFMKSQEKKRSRRVAYGIRKKYYMNARRYKNLSKHNKEMLVEKLYKDCPKFKRYMWGRESGVSNSFSTREVENELRRQDTISHDRIKTWTRVKVVIYGWVLIPGTFEITFRGGKGESKEFQVPQDPQRLVRAIARFLHGKINTFQDKSLKHVKDPIMLPFKSETRRMEEFVLAALYQARKGTTVVVRDVDFTVY